MGPPLPVRADVRANYTRLLYLARSGKVPLTWRLHARTGISPLPHLRAAPLAQTLTRTYVQDRYSTTLHLDPKMMHSRRRLRLTQTPKRSLPTRTPSFVFLESRPVSSSDPVIESCGSESCEMAAMINLERIPSRDALELATLEALKSNQRTINEDGQELTPEPAPSPAKLLNVPESHHVVNFKDLSPDPENERAPEIIRRSSGLDLPNPEPDSSSQVLHRRYLLRRPTKPQLPKDMDLEDLNNSGLFKRTSSSYDQFQEVIRRAEAEVMASITAENKESGEKAKPPAEPHTKKLTEPLKPPQPMKRTPSSYDQFQALIKQAEAEAMASLDEDKAKARVRRRSTRLESLRSHGSDLSEAMIQQYLLPDLYRDDSSSDESESVEVKVSKRRTRQYSNISNGTTSSETENKAPKPLIVDVDPEKAVKSMLRQRSSMALYNQSIAKRRFGTSALRRVRMNFRRSDERVTESRSTVGRGKQFPMLRKRVNTQDSSWSQLSSSNKKKKMPLAFSNQSSFDEPEVDQKSATKVLQHQLQAARQETAAAWQMVQQREKELFSMRRVLNFMERKVAQIEEDISEM
ncbi:hypothetical protein Ddc_15257 [Ditylenchus destructor]|nr:hypothetical protein Ddc_15257 [Ditylenchus destructor]